MQKAVREAKVHTSWIDEDQAYGRAVARFVEQALGGPHSPRFLRTFVPFQRRLAQAGMVNSLAQLVLKLASPGVADIYQGNELWDFSLVDPDNRRPVDFTTRRRLLEQLRPLIDGVERGECRSADVSGLLARWQDGAIKQLVTALGLRARRHHAEAVLGGAYVPLRPDGPAAEHVLAFARVHAAGTMVALVPRLVTLLTSEERPIPVGDAVWGSTRVLLPAPVGSGPYRHLVTGEVVEPVPAEGGAALVVADVLRTSPVALLWGGSPDR